MSGLEYFAQFLPRAATVVPLEFSYEQLRARNHELCGLDPAIMEADADAVGAAVAVLRDQCAAQEQLLLGLAAGWDGYAADAARATIGAHLDRGRETCAAMAAAHAAMSEAAAVIRAAAVDAADVGRAIDAADVGRAIDAADVGRSLTAPRIGGCSPHDVDVMIAVAALRPGDDAGGLLQQASGLFAELVPAAGDALLGLAVEASSTWLREVLVPHVQAQVAGFIEMCDATAEAVDGAHRLVADAVERVDPVPNPAPPATVVLVVAEDSDPYQLEPDGPETQPDPAPARMQPEPEQPEPEQPEPEPPSVPVTAPPRTVTRQGVMPAEPAESAESASGAELAEAGPL